MYQKQPFQVYRANFENLYFNKGTVLTSFQVRGSQNQMQLVCFSSLYEKSVEWDSQFKFENLLKPPVLVILVLEPLAWMSHQMPGLPKEHKI